MAHWKESGVDSVVSLLERGEEEELELAGERLAVSLQGMTFHSLPIVDRGVPESEGGLKSLVGHLDRELSVGRSVTLHCRQGVGRTGLVAVCLMIAKGFEVSEAIARLSDARASAFLRQAGSVPGSKDTPVRSVRRAERAATAPALARRENP